MKLYSMHDIVISSILPVCCQCCDSAFLCPLLSDVMPCATESELLFHMFQLYWTSLKHFSDVQCRKWHHVVIIIIVAICSAAMHWIKCEICPLIYHCLFELWYSHILGTITWHCESTTWYIPEKKVDESPERGHIQVTPAGPCISFSIWGGNVISWSREHGRSAVVHYRGVWGHAPPGNFADFRCSEVHSGAFWSTQRNTQTLLRRGSSS